MQLSETEDYQFIKKGFLLLPYPRNIRQRFLNDEMRLLSKSANYKINKEYILQANNPKYLFSKFHLNEIKNEIDSNQLDTFIVVGSHLTAKQHINLEELLSCIILDKFEIVLEIFAERAMTEESKLQIELAQLKYEKPRERLRLMHNLGLEGAWHSERSGFWGPGETPLNVLDLTMTKKEAILNDKLTLLKKQREKRRFKRKRYHHDSLYVSIVGYTSAGKSTILNNLTNTHASKVSSRLFETLDTRIRSFNLEDLKIFVSDTVGFIEDLPTFLIDSFKSTLEESLAADIILIVIDSSEPIEYMLQKAQISVRTITELNPHNHRVLVLNKIDVLSEEEISNRKETLMKHFPDLKIVLISAISDINPLKTEIGKFKPKKRYECIYSPNHTFRSFCHKVTFVEEEFFHNNKWMIKFSLRKPEYGLDILKHKARVLELKIELRVI